MAIRSRAKMLQEAVPPEITKQHTAADLILNPWLTSKERKRTFGATEDQVHQAIIRAWLEQVGTDCPSCGQGMKFHGKPKEQPYLVHIVHPNDGGSSKLDNLKVVCGNCFSDFED